MNRGRRRIIVGGEEIELPGWDFSRFGGRGLAIILAVVVGLWVLSGVYIVDPDEAGVVRRFGKALPGVMGPGPHYHLPYPFETVDTPKVEAINRIEIGFRTIDPGPPARYREIPKESLMLTGDENIVDAEVIIQYKIKDPHQFLFNVRNQLNTVHNAAEAALRQVVGSHNIDQALTEGKIDIQRQTEIKLQEIFDSYGIGLQITEVKLQHVGAPKQVDAAFKDVASAREDQERLIKEAEGYRNDIIPRTRGEAEQMIRQAEAYQVRRIEESKGDAEKFLAILKEYRKARDVTRTRMYLETLEEVLPRVQKYIVDSDGKGGVLNVVDLGKIIKAREGKK